MAPDTNRAARIATFLLAFVAYATSEVAAHSTGVPGLFGIAFGVGLFTAAGLLSAFGPKPAGKAGLPGRVQLLLAAGLGLPLVAEPALRAWTADGSPLELQLIFGLRALGVLLAGLGAWAKCRRLAAVIALFLALFASAMGDQPAVPYLLVALAVCGGVWLVFENRDRAGATAASGELVGRVPLRMPYRELAVFGVLAACAAVVAVAGPKRVLFTLGELMPTSGGSGDVDPFARSGVGDGPEEVAGDNARAAGMVESDRLIEDNKDALVDVVSDMFGPPHKPPKKQERMVAGGLADVIQNHGKLPDNRRPSRDFDTHRQGPKGNRTPDSQAARGLFEVSGRTPLHVRAVAYERYAYPAVARPDEWLAAVGGGFAELRVGGSMVWQQSRDPVSLGVEPHADGNEWMRSSRLDPTADWYADDDRHQFKIAADRLGLLPTPELLARFRIQRVDKPDYYRWENDGVLTLAGRTRVPPGIVVNTECRTLFPDRLPPHALAHGSGRAAFTELPTELDERIAAVAAAWTAGVPRGWPQLDAVVRALRTGYEFDPDARPPADHPHPVLWFLFESRRGPAYLFATAAALLLRKLDYPTRVCLGYYAAPDRYDPETDHTPVRAGDLHLWPEVLLRDGHWLVLEPTPGYAVLPPLRPWRERVADALDALAEWAKRNALALGAIALGVTALLWQRRRVSDAIATARHRLFPGGTWRERIVRAAKLLERRGRLAGSPRRPEQSLTAWADELAARRPGDPSLSDLARLTEWAVYAPALLPPPVPEAEVRSLCARAARAWPLTAFVRPPTGAPA